MGLQDRAAAAVRADPNVAVVASFNGGGSNTLNTGRMFITLKPRAERQPMKQVVEGLRLKMRELPGIAVYIRPIQNLQLGGRPSKAQYQYILQSVKADELNDWAGCRRRCAPTPRCSATSPAIRSCAACRPGCASTANAPTRWACPIDAVRSALYSAFGERQVSTIYTSADSYQVIMEVAPEAKRDESAFNGIYMRSNTGALVPLAAFATVERTIGPTAVNHVGQLQAVTVSFNLAPARRWATRPARSTASAARSACPRRSSPAYGGDAAVFKSSQGSQAILIIAALLVIYVLLGVLYESYIHPITILAGLPSAAVGALLTLRSFGMDLTLIATIGILLLIGIVKKNAIMMIDFALDQQRHHGMDPAHAIREACVLRFRPIMMTTLCLYLDRSAARDR